MAQRSYEVSIWTLQDEFISVLKASNVENKGQISEPKVIIKDDGTLELQFSLPMYLYEGKERIVNPLWYNTTNGNLIEDTRKIKLTFNKDTSVTKTFEFIILEVTDKHENDQLYCEVSCEGMAFHELGKRGYKISLTSDDFYDEDYEAFKSGGAAPHATLQYWLNKFLTPKPTNGEPIDKNTWYYEVQMDWSSYDNASLRDSHKIYEDIYISSWRYDDNSAIYKPDTVTSLQEKERMVDLEESNIYNLTQDLAEIFGVFCKYEYLYDANLHIIGRTIIFYNNYLQEKPQNEIGSYIDITYPYSTSAITRTRDGKDVTTKMFVRPADDNISPSGMVTIMDVKANKSQEDYLLNFDYMYSIGSISAEQYAAVPKFEAQIGQLNRQLRAIEGPMMAIENNIPELEAAITLHNNAIALDTERINNCKNLINELTGGTGDINVDATRPTTAILIESSKPAEEGKYYININEHGVKTETLQIFKAYDFSTPSLSDNDKLTGWVPKYDEFGNLYRVNFLSKSSSTDSSTVYLTYTYRPRLYYDNILNTWTTRLAQDREARDNATTELEDANTRLGTLKQQWKEINSSKKVLLDDFEKMMGAALRESYWQPDDFRDYGDSYSDSYSFSEPSGASNLSSFIFDKVPFDGEQLGYYKFGVNETITYYPVIDLSGNITIGNESVSIESIIKDNLNNNINLIFYDTDSSPTTTKDLRTFALGSQMQLGYINNNSAIKPVLIITDVENLTEASVKRMVDTGFIGTISSDEDEQSGNYSITVTSLIDPANTNFINAEKVTLSDSYTYTFNDPHLVYPRIKIDSLSLKTDDEHLMISINNNPLKNYEDYSVLERDDTNWTNNSINYSASYYISIKPINFIKYYSSTTSITCHFNISNADVSIYLDALQVLKENAYPKVSYTVEPSAIDKDFLYTLYNKLNYICNINDTDLKFKNVQGYISELELDCDSPWNDKIVIKNYKTKFEDLFSTIVAQTESMKKNSYAIALASSAFTATGTLDRDLIQNTLRRIDLNYAFNHGTLTIDEANGIWGTSDDGVVAFRGGGIFTATEKDNNGNWKWNTGIVPQGINADLITTGQLDTNLVRVFAGDDLKFQLNGDGLYAYRSWWDNTSTPSSRRREDGLDLGQYVVHNSEGLFLVAKAGTKYNNGLLALDTDVNRVAISWDGLTLKDWNNNPTLYADANTGDLHIKGNLDAATGTFTGTVNATGLNIVSGNTSQTIDNYLDGKGYATTSYVSSTYSTITQTNDKIDLAVNKIKVGGTNLFKKTQYFDDFHSGLWTRDNTNWSITNDTYNNCQVAVKENRLWNCMSQKISVNAGETYTYSAWIKAESSDRDTQKVQFISHRDGTSGHCTVIGTATQDLEIQEGTWTRISFSFTVASGGIAEPGIDIGLNYGSGDLPPSGTTVIWWICGIKFERGNKATDWCAAEDELYAGSNLSITSSGISMTGPSISMNGGNISMDGTGGIFMTSGNSNLTLTPTLLALYGDIRLNGQRVTTETFVGGKRIYVQMTQPSDTDCIWLKPTSVLSVDYTYGGNGTVSYTAINANASTSFTLTATQPQDTLYDTDMTYTLTIPLRRSSNSNFSGTLTASLSKNGSTVNFDTTDRFSGGSQDSVTFTTTTRTNLAGATGNITLILTASSYLWLDPYNAPFSLKIQNTSIGAGNQTCSVIYIPPA